MILYAPDISETIFNDLLGMGDVEYNKQLLMRRLAQRPKHPMEAHYWGIWELYQRLLGVAG